MNIKTKLSLRWQSLQALGIFVIAPALAFLLTPVVDFFKGNRAAISYTDTYVRNWDSLYITLPLDKHERLSRNERYHTETIKYDKYTKEAIRMHASLFFIKKYNRFFEIIWIKGIEDFVGEGGEHFDTGGIQSHQMEGGMVLCVYVNRTQWRDKSYGTKAKPMPAFLHRIVSGDKMEERNRDLMKMDSLFPDNSRLLYHYLSPRTMRRMRNTPDSINRIYAEYYLRYILPEDEFERLFEE